MGNLNSSIPKEILNAFAKKQGFSLLIKGDAGTGKTTLALEILARMPNAHYISSRIQPSSLYNYFPWIKNIPKENIIDGTQIKLLYPNITKKDAFINAVKFRNIPDFIKLIYQKAEDAKDSEKPTIVVDSWDAIIGATVQEWEKKNLPGNNETILTEITRQMNVNLILVVETAQKSFLDYIIDGIIQMEKKEFHNRRIRYFTIDKLRGIKIENFKYIYTLQNGRFHYFKPLKNIKEILPNLLINYSSSTDKINTRIKDFDNLIKEGFPIRSKNPIIINENIGTDYLILGSFQNNLIVYEMLSNTPLFGIDLEEEDTENIRLRLRPIL